MVDTFDGIPCMKQIERPPRDRAIAATEVATYKLEEELVGDVGQSTRAL